MTLDLKSWPMSMPGSKRRMIRKLWPKIPRPRRELDRTIKGGPVVNGRFVVPFFGTGVDSGHFVNEGYRVLASDIQPMIVGLHRDFANVVGLAHTWTTMARLSGDPRALFLELRDQHNEDPQPWTPYTLARHAHSQLVRHNRNGKYNAPFGELRTIPEPAIVAAHVDFIASIDGPEVRDFADTLALAQAGDVAYLDPPFFGTWDAYTGQPFDTPRLLSEIVQLRRRGISGALSNSPAIVDQFAAHGLVVGKDVEVHSYMRAGTISASGSERQPVGEVLVTWEGA